jgi:hypothetical protein
VKFTPENISAATVAEVSKYLTDGYGFFTDNPPGIAVVQEGHPQFEEAKRLYYERLAAIFKESR